MAFPGSQMHFEDVFAAGGKVACRFLMTGVHRGSFRGIPATGRTVALPGITILEFHEAQCVRHWSYTDSVGLLQQIGALPAP